MPFYRCLLHGENFALKVDDNWEPMGFYTTRWVRALNPKAAERRVIEKLRKEPLFQKPEGYEAQGLARVFVEEIVKLRFPPVRRPGGATWYPMNETT